MDDGAASISRYVVGFLFSEDRQHVVLIQKNRPAWQAGRLNGIGGKIESGETPEEAMHREFAEETGQSGFQWVAFAHLTDKVHFALDVFAATGTVDNVKTMTDEVVMTVPVESLPSLDLVENLPWLIPLALDVLDDRRPGFVTAIYPV